MSTFHAHAVMGVDVVVGQMHPVPIIHGRLPVLRRPALQQGAEAASLHHVRNWGAGVVEERRREINVEDDPLVDGAGLNELGVADQKRHAKRLFVHEPFVIPAVLAQEEPLVRGVDDDCVLAQAFLIEAVEQAADVVVGRRDAAQVVFDVSLVFPLLLLPSAEAGRRRAFEVHLGQVVVNAHRRGGCGAGPVAVIVVEGFGFGNLDVVVHVRVLLIRLPVPVRRFVVAEQAEGPVLVACSEPLDAYVGDEVGRVAFDDFLPAHLDHDRVVIQPLAGQNDPVVEPGGIVNTTVPQMPLADNGVLVAFFLKEFREGELPAVHRGAEGCDAVNVIVGAGENRSAAGGADRVGAEAVVESHAALGDAVHVWRLVDAAAVAAHRLRRVVVGHDKQNVRPLASLHSLLRCVRDDLQFLFV